MTICSYKFTSILMLSMGAVPATSVVSYDQSCFLGSQPLFSERQTLFIFGGLRAINRLIESITYTSNFNQTYAYIYI
ncbi:Uncharacterized protein HZ326_4985 [Fusarium oxysporum f. sp. albedinis]|nr:Uncharacterized protein HZ326_4985 [Fusarium oxysporum f. sp. albedinis]